MHDCRSRAAPRRPAGKEPENIDKEFLRLWFKDRCDPYKDKVLPGAAAGSGGCATILGFLRVTSKGGGAAASACRSRKAESGLPGAVL